MTNPSPKRVFEPLVWTQETDSQRPGAKLWSALLADSYVVVQEVSIGSWGWCLMDNEGWPRQMNNEFTNAEDAKASFEQYVDENGA